ncbi:hypothetical protein GGQ97_000942 [Sphingomonas kaistensis]|uniref:Uncharacterized protein n=1 Tax=Sphingomonas kaistensis TaxID=298708 RepID=A0A7X5Y4Q6_9SPHN|nr:hypothetical protein [Sphingomonas kaistensis]
MSTPATPQDSFFAQLSEMCGKAFEGRIVSPAVSADASFAGKKLVMHVRECSSETLRIPFHVGEDRSRTWVMTRIANGLRLKHDHRHEDGSPSEQTQYGGDTVDPGSSNRQQFPADAFSKEMFVRGNIPQSATNVWAMEVWQKRLFAYELRRPGRHFRVEFDLARPIPTPPPPWGAGRPR